MTSCDRFLKIQLPSSQNQTVDRLECQIIDGFTFTSLLPKLDLKTFTYSVHNFLQ